MNRTLTAATALICLLFVGFAHAQEADPAPAPPTGATEPAQPAPKPAAKKPPEVLQDAVDPLNPVAERTRFFTVAGVDNEMSAEEFATAKGKKGSFARNFDNFKAMLAFDKDGNGKLDWFESLAYRQDIRQRVLAAFDANKDGKLVGDERDKANAALAAGKVPGRAAIWTRPTPPVPLTPRPAGGTIPPREAPREDPEMIKKYDRDNDGQLSREERRDAWRARMEETRKEALEKYDANNNGKLDPEERQAAYKEAMDRWLPRVYDRDGDGELSEGEAAEMEKGKQRFQEMREGWAKRREENLKKYDADEDGQLNQEERRAMWTEMRQGWARQMYDKDGDGVLNEREKAVQDHDNQLREKMATKWRQSFLKKYDVDGDGELSEEENQIAREAVRGEMRKLADDWRAKWDDDGDGKLSADERGAMIASIQQRVAELRKEIDTDGDGKTSPQELRGFMLKLRDTYDVDEDGVLSPEETREMVKEMMKTFRRPRPRRED